MALMKILMIVLPFICQGFSKLVDDVNSEANLGKLYASEATGNERNDNTDNFSGRLSPHYNFWPWKDIITKTDRNDVNKNLLGGVRNWKSDFLSDDWLTVTNDWWNRNRNKDEYWKVLDEVLQRAYVENEWNNVDNRYWSADGFLDRNKTVWYSIFVGVVPDNDNGSEDDDTEDDYTADDDTFSDDEGNSSTGSNTKTSTAGSFTTPSPNIQAVTALGVPLSISMSDELLFLRSFFINNIRNTKDKWLYNKKAEWNRSK